MKALMLVIVALVFTTDLAAQVIFRNDFIIKGRHKIQNAGLSSITINLGRYPNFNQLINGRGGRTLVIDVRALRGKTDYTYSEIAEKVYMPPVYTGPIVQSVPKFLLVAPRPIITLRSRSYPAQR